MKKLILAVMTMGLGASLYAQGTVVFANSSSTLIPPPPSSGAGTNVQLALYWGVAGSTEAQLVQIGPTTGLGPVTGRINAGNYTTGAATAPGSVATFQVRGWTGGYATYEDAYGAWLNHVPGVDIGWTAVFNSATGGAGSPPGAPVTLAGVMPGYSWFIPEPSTYALMEMGLLGLLWKPVRRMVSK